MVKIMILLKRRENLSMQEFKDWWLGAHKDLAVRLPKLRKACYDVVEDDEDTLYDGIAELSFDSVADFHAAYHTEIGQKVTSDSLSHVSKRDRLITHEFKILGG